MLGLPLGKRAVSHSETCFFFFKARLASAHALLGPSLRLSFARQILFQGRMRRRRDTLRCLRHQKTHIRSVATSMRFFPRQVRRESVPDIQDPS